MDLTVEPTCVITRGASSHHVVIEVRGELDLAGVPLLESAIRELELSTLRGVVLDLRPLVFIDATGLNAVLNIYAECLDRATTLTIIPGPRSVHRLFELTRLDKTLPFSRP